MYKVAELYTGLDLDTAQSVTLFYIHYILNKNNNIIIIIYYARCLYRRDRQLPCNEYKKRAACDIIVNEIIIIHNT